MLEYSVHCCLSGVSLQKNNIYFHFSNSSFFFSSPLFALQVARVGGQEEGSLDGCVPGFQVKRYQLPDSGPFQMGQALLQGQETNAGEGKGKKEKKNICAGLKLNVKSNI